MRELRATRVPEQIDGPIKSRVQYSQMRQQRQKSLIWAHSGAWPLEIGLGFFGVMWDHDCASAAIRFWLEEVDKLARIPRNAMQGHKRRKKGRCRGRDDPCP